jgi:hypothetical protein
LPKAMALHPHACQTKAHQSPASVSDTSSIMLIEFRKLTEREGK